MKEYNKPFDYLKNCIVVGPLVIDGWCSERIHVRNDTLPQYLKQIEMCKFTEEHDAYLKQLDNGKYIRAWGFKCSYNTDGWIDFDPSKILYGAYPNGNTVTNCVINNSEIIIDEIQNTIFPLLSIQSSAIASVHPANLSIDLTIHGIISIDPDMEDDTHKSLYIKSILVRLKMDSHGPIKENIVSGEIGYVGTFYEFTTTISTALKLSDEAYGTNDLHILTIQIFAAVAPNYGYGYNSTRFVGEITLNSIADTCGDHTYFPPNTSFKVNPINWTCRRAGFVIEFDDTEVY